MSASLPIEANSGYIYIYIYLFINMTSAFPSFSSLYSHKLWRWIAAMAASPVSCRQVSRPSLWSAHSGCRSRRLAWSKSPPRAGHRRRTRGRRRPRRPWGPFPLPSCTSRTGDRLFPPWLWEIPRCPSRSPRGYLKNRSATKLMKGECVWGVGRGIDGWEWVLRKRWSESVGRG